MALLGKHIGSPAKESAFPPSKEPFVLTGILNELPAADVGK